MAPFSYRALTSWKNRFPPPEMTGRYPNFVDDEQGEAAKVPDAIAQRAVAFGLRQRSDDVCERTEVDAPAGFDRFDPEGQAQMRLAGSGRAYEMHGFGAIDELQSGERQNTVLVERGLEGEVEACEGFDRRELGHLDGHFDAAVLPDGELFGQQRVDSLDGADFTALDAAQGDVEDFQGARHFQSDEARFDMLDDGRGAHLRPPRAASRRPTAA